KTVSESEFRAGKTIIGFALEPDINLDEGWRKLKGKKLDGIIVNTCASFCSNEMDAIFLKSDDTTIELGQISKTKMADHIISHIISHIKGLHNPGAQAQKTS
ncbi:MAG: hypothetical protein JXR97_15345, partial [Planctomycetes bacterium]|nr:hypothetical protein [Planctomycetota bacterium]